MRPKAKRPPGGGLVRSIVPVDALAPFVDVSVDKVAYSAFFSTQLDWVLRHAGIDAVAVCGEGVGDVVMARP